MPVLIIMYSLNEFTNGNPEIMYIHIYICMVPPKTYFFFTLRLSNIYIYICKYFMSVRLYYRIIAKVRQIRNYPDMMNTLVKEYAPQTIAQNCNLSGSHPKATTKSKNVGHPREGSGKTVSTDEHEHRSVPKPCKAIGPYKKRCP